MLVNAIGSLKEVTVYINPSFHCILPSLDFDKAIDDFFPFALTCMNIEEDIDWFIYYSTGNVDCLTPVPFI